MPLSRRALLTSAGTLTAALALPGCSGFTGSSSEPTGDRTLSFTTWGSDSELAGFRSVIDAFQKANPGDTVTLNSVPYEQFFQNIDAQLQSNTAPDLFRVDYDNLGTYAGRGQLLDLSATLDPNLGSQFTDALWSAVQYQGKPHGVPHHTDTSAILYSTAAFEAAGITSVPSTVEDAWTWEEFEAVAQKLQKAAGSGKYAFAYNWQGQGITRWLSWLFQAGGRFLDDQLTGPAIDSDAGAAAVDFTKSFFTQKYVPANSAIKAATYASDLFFAQTVGMVFAGAFLIPDAAKLAKFDWKATFSPRKERGGGDLGGNALVATAKTQKAELAAKFLTFVTSTDQMRNFCATSSLLPTRKDLVQQGIEFSVRPELSKVFVGQATTVQPQDAAQIASPAMAKINTVLSDNLEQAFTGGRSTQDTIAGITAGIKQALTS